MIRPLRSIEKKLETILTAIEDLTTAVQGLEADETAAAAEFKKLAQLLEEAHSKEGGITAAEVETLAQQAAKVGEALKAATPST